MSARRGLIDMKRAVPVLLIVFLILSTSGCFGGGTPPTLKEEVSILDTALAEYSDAKNIYRQGDYQNAKQAFIASADRFKACQSTFDSIAKSDISTLEKRAAVNLAGGSGQYAHAAAYMRDACTEELKGPPNNAYLMKVSADEFEQTAKNNCDEAREDLQRFWSSN